MEKKNNAGVAFAAKMKSEYSEGVDQRAAADEQRVVAAQQAVVKQLVNLKTHMKRAGHREERDGKIHVSYGALFEAVQGIMPTLSGTLKTARRLGIVAFEGETLFQGVSNGVDITLLDESDKSDYAVVVREKGKHGKETERDPFALDNQAKTITACARCGKPVMPADRVGVSDRVLHQSCFECHLDECNVHLTAGTALVTNFSPFSSHFFFFCYCAKLGMPRLWSRDSCASIACLISKSCSNATPITPPASSATAQPSPTRTSRPISRPINEQKKRKKRKKKSDSYFKGAAFWLQQ